MAAIFLGCLLIFAGVLLWRIYPATDAALSTMLRLQAGQPAVPLLVAATMLGGAAVMIPVGLAAILFLSLTGRRRAGAWAFLVIASGRILVECTKYLIGRTRPPADTHLVSVTTASFPSSHSAGNALTIVALLVAFRAPRAAWAVGGLWILLIGLSRVLLGVHWPSDVLAGWGIGLAWVAIFYFDKARGDATF